MLGIERLDVLSAGGVEEREIPFSLEQAASHNEQLLGWMKCQRLHQSLSALAFVRFIKLLPVAPRETLPALNAVPGLRVSHRTHAAHVKLVAARVKHHRENTAQIMVALDDPPAREIRRLPFCNLPARSRLPDANF